MGHLGFLRQSFIMLAIFILSSTTSSNLPPFTDFHDQTFQINHVINQSANVLATTSASVVQYFNDSELIDKIHDQCPAVSDGAIEEGIKAYHHAHQQGLDDKQILTIVDFSKPSDQKRLCSVNLAAQNLVYTGQVAHGVNSGSRFATTFSNIPNQHKSSLGLYLTGEPYYGVAGYSLKLYGLDKGLNDNAYTRHVVLHGTPHVSEQIAAARDQVGHSLGCFGISQQAAKTVINNLKGGTLIFAYYPTETLEEHSVYLRET